MKYKFKEFKKEKEKSTEENFDLLIEHYNQVVKDMKVGQSRNSTFDDQFDSFSKEITIAAHTEGRVTNELSDTPTEWMVIDSKNAPAGALVRGSTKWGANTLHLVNTSSYSVTFKVRFFAGKQNEQPLSVSDSGISSATTDIEMLGGSSQSTSTSRSTYTISSITESSAISGSWSLASNVFTFPGVGRYEIEIEQDSITADSQNTVSFFLRNDTDSSDSYAFLQYQTNVATNHKNIRFRGAVTIAAADASDSFSFEWVIGSGTVTQNGPGRIFIRKVG